MTPTTFLQLLLYILVFALLLVFFGFALKKLWGGLKKKKKKPQSPKGYGAKRDPENVARSIPQLPPKKEATPRPSTRGEPVYPLWFSTTEMSSLPGVEVDVVNAAFTPGLSRLFIANHGDWVQSFNVHRRQPGQDWFCHPGGVSALGALGTSAGDFVISGGRDGRLLMATAALYEAQLAFDAHHGAVTAIAVNPHANGVERHRFFSAGEDRHIRYWDSTGALLNETLLPLVGTNNGVEHSISALTFAPDAKTLLILSPNGGSWEWRLNRSGLEALMVLPLRPLNLVSVRFWGGRVIAHDRKQLFHWEGDGPTHTLPLRHRYDKIVAFAPCREGLWCIDQLGRIGLEELPS